MFTSIFGLFRALFQPKADLCEGFTHITESTGPSITNLSRIIQERVEFFGQHVDHVRIAGSDNQSVTVSFGNHQIIFYRGDDHLTHLASHSVVAWDGGYADMTEEVEHMFYKKEIEIMGKVLL